MDGINSLMTLIYGLNLYRRENGEILLFVKVVSKGSSLVIPTLQITKHSRNFTELKLSINHRSKSFLLAWTKSMKQNILSGSSTSQRTTKKKRSKSTMLSSGKNSLQKRYRKSLSRLNQKS